MANRHTKRCSTSLIIREMYIKTTARYQRTPVRTVIIKMTRNNKCWWGCGVSRALVLCGWECKTVSRNWRQNYCLRLQFHTSIHLRGVKSLSQKDTCIPVFIAAAFSETWKQHTCLLMDDWLKKIHACITHMYILFSHKTGRKSCRSLQHGWILRALY